MKEFGLIIKLVIAIVLIMLLGDYVPEGIQRGFYTVSVILKEVLLFCMPYIIFVLIFACLSTFRKKAPLLIVMILAMVVASNFVFVQMGYFAGNLFLPLLGFHSSNGVNQLVNDLPPLEPFFSLPLLQLVSIDMALLLGTLAGLYGAFFGHERLASWGTTGRNIIQAGLNKVFIPLVPLYVIGFLFKVQHDESLLELFTGYGPIIGVIFGIQAIVIILFYFVANLGNFKATRNSLGNVIPSGLVAFSTMSSMATLPLTLEAAEENTENKAVAEIMIPATVNIHHVGDSIAIPILVAIALVMSGAEPMSYGTFLIFSLYYMVAKFGVPSVPGGELVVLFPVLVGSFGFTDSMCGFMTTLYLLLDPSGTVTNVLCNGALTILMDKICGRMKAFQSSEEPLAQADHASLG